MRVVELVDARNGHIFRSIAEILDVDETLVQRELGKTMDPPVEAEEVDGHGALGDSQISVKFGHVSKSQSTRSLIHNRLLGLLIFALLTIPAAQQRN